MWEVMFWPIVACVLLPWLLVYLGLHVVQRGIIFIDIAMAQMASLGICVAVLRWGRRGLQPWQRWLVFVLLFAALGIDRLPRVWQLVLVAAGAGYFAAFVVVLGLRIVRVARPP